MLVLVLGLPLLGRGPEGLTARVVVVPVRILRLVTVALDFLALEIMVEATLLPRQIMVPVVVVVPRQLARTAPQRPEGMAAPEQRLASRALLSSTDQAEAVGLHRAGRRARAGPMRAMARQEQIVVEQGRPTEAEAAAAAGQAAEAALAVPAT